MNEYKGFVEYCGDFVVVRRCANTEPLATLYLDVVTPIVINETQYKMYRDRRENNLWYVRYAVEKYEE